MGYWSNPYPFLDYSCICLYLIPTWLVRVQQTQKHNWCVLCCTELLAFETSRNKEHFCSQSKHESRSFRGWMIAVITATSFKHLLHKRICQSEELLVWSLSEGKRFGRCSSWSWSWTYLVTHRGRGEAAADKVTEKSSEKIPLGNKIRISEKNKTKQQQNKQTKTK